VSGALSSQCPSHLHGGTDVNTDVHVNYTLLVSQQPLASCCHIWLMLTSPYHTSHLSPTHTVTHHIQTHTVTVTPHTRTHSHTHAHKHTHLTHTHSHMHTHTTHTHAHTHHTHTHTNTHTLIHTHTHTHSHTQSHTHYPPTSPSSS